MAITVKKVKKPAIVETAPVTAFPGTEIEAGTSNEVAQLIDEIGASLPAAEKLMKQIKDLQIKLKPHAEKLKALVAMVSPLPGYAHDAVFTQEGELYVAAIGKRSMSRSVTDVKKAIALLNAAKPGVAYQVVSVPLGKLDEYLTPEERKQVIKIDWADRSVTIAKKAALDKAA